MKIICLMENTTCYDDIKAQHGLSFYIEWNQRKILFDTGASDLFVENAKQRNVDLNAVDTVILSHVHYDHSGGIQAFLERNNHATLYIREKALEPHFHIHDQKISYIGIPKNIIQELKHPLRVQQIHFTKEWEVIEDGCILFSNVTGNQYYSKGNDGLAMQKGITYVTDDFSHEQNLILKENGKWILISGCSHSGVVNIIEKCKTLIGKEPDILIGGFHFAKPEKDGSIDTEFAAKIGTKLQTYHTKYYTCHCTRVEYYQYLKQQMGEQIEYIGAGDELEWKENEIVLSISN